MGTTVLVMSQFGSAQELNLESETSRQAYSIGINVGRNLLKQGVQNVDETALFRGISDAVNQKDTAMTEDEMRATLTAFSKILRDRQVAERQQVADKNLADGQEFLAKNKERDGIIETPSGLQYEVIQTGAGASPGITDKVNVHYRGTLLDGTEFDSSYSRNKPASFPLNRVIKGWTEGLQLMSPGSKYKFYIPSDLAYGESGNQSIPPNSTLIFEVELLEVEAVAPPKPKVVTSDIIKVPSAEGLKKGEKIEIIKAEDVEKEIEKQTSESSDE